MRHRRSAAPAGTVAILVLVGAVAWSSLQPASGADGPAGEAFGYFQKSVAPVLAASCSMRGPDGVFSCHGQPPEQYRRLSTEAHPPEAPQFFFPVDPKTGLIATAEQAREAYDRILRGHTGPGNPVTRWVDRRYDPRFSPLLRKPVADTMGGMVHGGGNVFTSPSDPGYKTLARWIEMERQRAPETPEPLEGGAAGRFYQSDVLPVMVNRSCMVPSCHEFHHSSLRFDPGVASNDLAEPSLDRFNSAIVNTDRKTTLGLITNQLYLTGDVSLSRIIRKAIPLRLGGELHKGGNDTFLTGPDDPDFATLVKWAGLEREELLKRTRIDGRPVAGDPVGHVRGIVFVRTPVTNSRRFLDAGKYLPGGDLWLLKVREGETPATATSRPINLTARFHRGREADVRKPDVRYDGRAVVFAMRVGEKDALNIYEIGLDDSLDYVEGSLRRLTWGPEVSNGLRVHFTDPVYVPDADDENAATGGSNLERADIAFASNLDGGVAPSEPYETLGEADGGDTRTILDWERTEPDGSFVGRRVRFVTPDGRGPVRTIVSFRSHVFDTAPSPAVIGLDAPLGEPVRGGAVYAIERGGPVPFLPAFKVYGIKQPPRGREQEYFRDTLVRVTHGLSGEMDLSVRSSGEVYYASLRNTGYLRHKPVFNMGRNRRHLDKSLSFPTHRGNRSRVPIYAQYQEMPDGSEIFTGLGPDSVWEAGALFVADHQVGCGIERGNPVDGAVSLYAGAAKACSGDAPSHPRAVPPITEVSPFVGPKAVSFTGWSPGGAFRDPRPLPDGTLLVSYSSRPLLLSSPAAKPDFDLYVLAGDHGGLRGEPGGLGLPSIRLLPVKATRSGMAEVQAVPVMARFKQRIRAATRAVADRMIQPFGVDHTDPRPGRFCDPNYLLLDAFLEDNIPVGRHAAYDQDPVTGRRLDPSERVAYVRIAEGLAFAPEDVTGVDPSRVANADPESTRLSNGIHPAKRIVVEAPIEADGSVCVPVPANTPFIYQSLNEDRLALRTQTRWYAAAPNESFSVAITRGESFQLCAGCHGSVTGKATDTYGPMDLKHPEGCQKACHSGPRYAPARPPSPAGGDPLADGVSRLAPDARVEVGFETDIQPILDRHCVACHAGKAPAAGLDLTGQPTAFYSRAYENLMALRVPADRNWDDKEYVAEREALAIESYLVEKLYGREMRAPRPLSGDFPHPSADLIRRTGVAVKPLDDLERLTVARWIDLGAVFRYPAARRAGTRADPAGVPP